LKHFKAITVVIILILMQVPDVYAQYENERDATIPLDHFYIKRRGTGTFRKLFSKVTFGLSTGYGSSAIRHEFDDFQLLQNPGAAPIIFQPSSTSGYTNWLNKVESEPLPPVTGTVFDASQEKIGFRSSNLHIPLRATLHVEFNRFRIGGGYSLEFTRLGDFKPLTHPDEIGNFTPDVSNFFLKKYFFSLGASVYRYYEYLLVADVNLGGYKLGKDFDNSVIDRGMFVNLGVSLEREMSEYFRLFVRPSYELKGFSTGIPETSTEIDHRFNAFYINVGATYRIPELRRCFLKTCKAQLNHAHGNREYRSRVHPIYKKQNPHYGENHPTLIKYKGRNKYKLNPY
jgi:hypothetical protein